MTVTPHGSADVKLVGLRAFLDSKVRKLEPPFPETALFLSVSDGNARAFVVEASGASLDAAWQAGVERLGAAMQARKLAGKWIRIDWVEGVEAVTWRTLRGRLARTKRNYFRYGLALDKELRFAFSEQELNANAMFYGGNAINHAVVNEKNFSLHFQAQYGQPPFPLFKDDDEVFLLSTGGAFCDENGDIFELIGAGPNAGRRNIEQLAPANVTALIGNAGDYLARQVKDNGSFIYGYHPCFDRTIDAYNALRHASTTYAMIEAWEVTRDEKLGAAIERSLACLTTSLIHSVSLPSGEEAAFLVDVGNEIKLGGNAVAILALTKYCAVTGTQAHLALAQKLANGILHMQNDADGSFSHVLNFPSLSIKQKFRTIYYDGEAAFGLMRLFEATGEARWLAAVEKAFDHFIASDHWKHHDHWLSYCVNELTRYRPEERYLRFGVRNVAGYLDFVSDRITTFPTLLELMMAARETLSRIDENPKLHHLLAEVDVRQFEAALEKRAHYLLNGHFWPEFAMFYRSPDKIAGSFFIRHHAFRVRIDDVEHYLSGFVAYLRYLDQKPRFLELAERHAPLRRTPQIAYGFSPGLAASA